MTDVLTTTLEALRLRGTVYFQADFRAPWGMAVPAKNVAAFHVVSKGECWLRIEGAEPLHLVAGDIVLLPRGSAHELVHGARGTARPAEEALERQRSVAESGGAVTNLVCGHFEYDGRGLHPFFRSLPEVLHVSADAAEQASWLATAARLAAAESSSGQRGSSIVVDRLAEALLIQTIRLYLDGTMEPTGFVAAVRYSQIGCALARMHEEPERQWTLGELARIAGLSRLSFSERFRYFVGETPMRYLTNWRMLAARTLLERGQLSTAEVARRAGYQSEFAFAKAFKRRFGKGPGAARRTA